LRPFAAVPLAITVGPMSPAPNMTRLPSGARRGATPKPLDCCTADDCVIRRTPAPSVPVGSGSPERSSSRMVSRVRP